ncbi:ATP synthase F1 subunit epsilon [bacterium]|nr:ATP synthase F1 subunit epsilon [bacterium]NBX97961.1 ATP synthase F1 subunit epsilon [bacterium]NDC94412.1 ATP synthase F1 subunit epsilon [bacterium]NDD83798.1 ATP synthase F1 subunit epsilon [bacterium]NDG28795.1 ATP synthase F1 subunit epsilon [bacterium]
MHFTLYSLDGVKFDDQVYEVIIPTLDGIIGVLPGHMPLISVATDGVILVRRTATERDDQRDVFAISGGTVQVENDQLRVLVDEADSADSLNEKEVQDAYERAKNLKANAKDHVSLQNAQAMMDRHAVRLQVASMKRRKK